MTSIEVMGVREKIRSHVGAESAENIIFTSNCSEALNYAILGSVKRGGHIIITCNEHNSVYRPVEYLKKTIMFLILYAKQTQTELSQHMKLKS